MTIKIRTFEADYLADLQQAIQSFYDENPTVERKDFIKTYFNSVYVHYDGYHGHVQHHAFIVYEDIKEDGLVRK
jgi:hypothetical protein